MGVSRRLTALLAAFALVALPACVGTGPLLPLRPPVEVPPPPLKTTAGKTRPAVQFASLPSGPGERVPLNPVPLVPQLAAADPPPAIDPPPTVIPIEPGELPPLEVTPALVQAFQAFHDNQPEKALGHLSHFDQANQELLLQLIPAVVQAARTDLNRPDSEEAATLARQFESAAAAVLKRGGFTVRKAVVCLSVGGFGVYRPVDDPALRPGGFYSVYLELANVPCLPDTLPDGAKGFLTRLECEMRVTDEFGRTVEILDVNTKTPGPKSTSSKSEYTRSPLNDCYLAAVLQTPNRPGAYVVTFEVRDPRSGRSVSKPIPFRVQ